MRDCFEKSLERARRSLIELRVALELGSNEAIKEAVLRGVGVAILGGCTRRNQFGLLNVLAVEGPIRFALALVLLDGWMYVWHRANHTFPLLWRFHRMHHSDRRMDVKTATRFHLGEHVGSSVLKLGLIPLLGFEGWHLVVYETLVVATQFQHADLSVGRWDRWLWLLIVTPHMHEDHHSDRRDETDSNYSTVAVGLGPAPRLLPHEG